MPYYWYSSNIKKRKRKLSSQKKNIIKTVTYMISTSLKKKNTNDEFIAKYCTIVYFIRDKTILTLTLTWTYINSAISIELVREKVNK